MRRDKTRSAVKQLLISVAIATLLTPPFAGRVQAQGRGGNTGQTVEGGVSFINPGPPVVSDAEATGKPIPRLPDGKVDLTGPWIGGGAIADIERDGGLKPGELPLLPWAKELRDRRKSQDDPYTACLPM